VALPRVSTKGQLVIPADIRKRKGFTPGSYVMVEETEDGVFLRSPGDDPTKAACGMFAHLGPVLKDYLKEHLAESELEERKEPWPPTSRQ
jgi:AbrB family looped-hinge helix DNA binding protein